jgi:hypothetical protein
MAFALALPSNSKTRPERVTKGKPSSLVGLVVSDEGKKFYNIKTWKKKMGWKGLDVLFHLLHRRKKVKKGRWKERKRWEIKVDG